LIFGAPKICRHFKKFRIGKKFMSAQTPVNCTMLNPNNSYFGFLAWSAFHPKAAPKKPGRHT